MAKHDLYFFNKHFIASPNWLLGYNFHTLATDANFILDDIDMTVNWHFAVMSLNQNPFLFLHSPIVISK